MFTLATIPPKTAEIIPSSDLAAKARAGLREFKSKEKEKEKVSAAPTGAGHANPASGLTAPTGAGHTSSGESATTAIRRERIARTGGDGDPTPTGNRILAAGRGYNKKGEFWATDYVKRAGLQKLVAGRS